MYSQIAVFKQVKCCVKKVEIILEETIIRKSHTNGARKVMAEPSICRGFRLSVYPYSRYFSSFVVIKQSKHAIF